MPPLLYRQSIALGAGGAIDYIRITNLGKVKLRLISIDDVTDIALIQVSIIDKNDPVTSLNFIQLFWAEQIRAGFPVAWEGELDLGEDQDVRITFLDPSLAGVTAGDILLAQVGFEYQ